jgi:hypothetical protein
MSAPIYPRYLAHTASATLFMHRIMSLTPSQVLTFRDHMALTDK